MARVIPMDFKSSVWPFISLLYVPGPMGFSPEIWELGDDKGGRSRGGTEQVLIYPASMSGAAIRKRIPNCEEKPKASVRNIVNAVGILERWLWRVKGESRRIETLPPQLLDSHLADFFLILRKPRTGDDYDPISYSKVRSYLERFLKENDYPHSISKSPLFDRSQIAYRQKWESLVAKKVLPSRDTFTPDSAYNLSWWKTTFKHLWETLMPGKNLVFRQFVMLWSNSWKQTNHWTEVNSHVKWKPLGMAQEVLSSCYHLLFSFV